MLFKEIMLKPGILKSLAEIGYENATPIQEKVIPIALEGKNIIGQSQTGTGKTAAFLLPLLNNIDTNLVEHQALILAPTRELIVQTYEEIYKLTKYYRVSATGIYGGVSQVNQVKEIKKVPRIIIATPGRLLDLIEQRLLNLRTIKYLILDEVDRMLDMGFLPDIKKIRNLIPNVTQTMSFSATINNEILKTMKQYLKDYELIKTSTEIIVDKVNHSYVYLDNKDKFINLTKLISMNKQDKIIIFTNTKRNSEIIYNKLKEEGHEIGVLNGDIRQSKRLATLTSYVKGRTRILVTTDVAARGLNMNNIGLVINFDVPRETESYIHRIGRTARAGESGKAITFVSPQEKYNFKGIENKYQIKIQLSDYKQIYDIDGIYTHLLKDKINSTRSSSSKYGSNNNNSNSNNNNKKKIYVFTTKDDRNFEKKSGNRFENRNFRKRGKY